MLNESLLLRYQPNYAFDVSGVLQLSRMPPLNTP